MINIELTGKQNHILAIAKKYGIITIHHVEEIYQSKDNSIIALNELVQLGLIQNSQGLWRITEKGRDY